MCQGGGVWGCTPPPRPPDTVSNEHFPFRPYFLRTQFIRYPIKYQTSEPSFQAQGLGKSGAVVLYLVVMVPCF